MKRIEERLEVFLADKLKKAQPGDDLTRYLPCYLAA